MLPSSAARMRSGLCRRRLRVLSSVLVQHVEPNVPMHSAKSGEDASNPVASSVVTREHVAPVWWNDQNGFCRGRFESHGEMSCG